MHFRAFCFCTFLLVACSHGPISLPKATTPTAKAPPQARGQTFAIAAEGPAAAAAGKRMAQLGGNAVDAAVAASFAISVERPHGTGLGGGGFLLLHLAATNRTLAFDFRETAPSAAHSRLFLNSAGEPLPNASTDGPLAVGVPGLVAGLLEVHQRFGKLPLAQVLAPAIELAEEGFVVYPGLALALKDRAAVLSRFASSRAIFLKADGSPYQEGERLVQKDLGRTLRALAQHGRRAFYSGAIASSIARTVRQAGGLLTLEDMRTYQVKERSPLAGTFRGHELAAMPPPSSGGAHVIQILNMVEQDPLAQWGPGAPESVHLVASAMQRAFADRAEHLGDGDFVPVPLAGLTSKSYAAALRAKIPPRAATRSSQVRAGTPPGGPDHTTHLSVMDAEGNAVATTQTINGWMGSGLVAEGTGVLLNNQMDDFATAPGVPNLYGAIGGAKNAVAGHKRPLSSMSPTLVFRGGRAVLALGSPSGTRIISCVAQTLLNRLAHGMPLSDAIAAVRYHHQWLPDEIRVDAPGLPPTTTRALQSWGYQVREQNLGCQISAVEKEAGDLNAVADPRAEGTALAF